MGNRILIAAALLLVVEVVGVVPVMSDQTEFSGFIAGEVRVFPRSPVHADQTGAVLHPSLAVQPEYRYQWNGDIDRITVVPFVRLDAQDKERTHLDLRELNWLHVGEYWELRLGVGKVFWGVIESRHLADIINQTDLVESPDEEDKLGQPMIKLALLLDGGSLDFFLLPAFRERTFPGRKGRLRGAIPVDSGQPVYESSLKEWHPDLAVRWTRVLGDWDMGLAHFWGTGREPRLLPGRKSSGRPVLIPHYDLIHQTSLDLQATKGSWLWKLEALTRGGQGSRFAALGAGFEYSFFGILGTSADLGFLGEYLYDGRGAGAPGTSFDDDFFGGLRLTLNDAEDTDILAGIVVDRLSGASFLSLEADTRLADHWTLEVEGRVSTGLPQQDPGFGARADHYFQIRLARYF